MGRFTAVHSAPAEDPKRHAVAAQDLCQVCLITPEPEVPKTNFNIFQNIQSAFFPFNYMKYTH